MSLLFLLPSLSLSLYESSHNASLPQLLHGHSLSFPHSPSPLSPSPFNPRPQRRQSLSSLSPFRRRRPHIPLGHQTDLPVQLGRRQMRQQPSHHPPSPRRLSLRHHPERCFRKLNSSPNTEPPSQHPRRLSPSRSNHLLRSPSPLPARKQILRQIPESLFSLTNLVRLNLAENSFTGGTDSPVDLTVPSLEFSARPRPRLGCGWWWNWIKQTNQSIVRDSMGWIKR